MISNKKFHKLKLKALISRKDTDRVIGYEFLSKLWLGETYAFSHALRLFSSPFKTKSIAITVSDFEDLTFDFLLGEDLKNFSTRDVCDAKFGEPILNDGGLAYFTMDTTDVSYNKALHRTSPECGVQCTT